MEKTPGLRYAAALLLAAGLGLATVLGAAGSNHPDADKVATANGELLIHPLNHATMALRASDLVIYVDPVGGARFRGIPQPTLILITDIHDDHLSAETVNAVRTPHTVIVAPEAMQSELESGGETACARSAETYCRASFRPFRSTQS